MPMTTPYTNSRARVLAAYRRQREQGTIPAHAMEAVLVNTHRALLDPMVDTDARTTAELEWDRAHARRYLGWIDNKTITSQYWRTGKGDQA